MLRAPRGATDESRMEKRRFPYEQYNKGSQDIFCASQWIFRRARRLPRIDHIDTAGFWPGSRQRQKPWTWSSNAIRNWLSARLARSLSPPELQPDRKSGLSNEVPAAAFPGEAAPSPFRAAVHSGKVPPQWGPGAPSALGSGAHMKCLACSAEMRLTEVRRHSTITTA